MIGQTLNGCLIESIVAVTTTGTVYQAKDVLLEVHRAIKILHPQLVEKEMIRKRFKMAIQAWAKLDNPYFAQLFFAIENEKDLGFIMDFIQGTTLREILKKQGRLGISQAVDYFLQILKAIAFAHKQGVLHRKLAPENVKVGEDESVKILGMGSLRTIDLPRSTPPNLYLGKVHYMAPEQFKGIYSIQSDQYTLGAIFYEMVTGHVPYRARTIPEIYKKHALYKPIPPRELNSQITPELEHIILKMLAKKPEERFSDLSGIVESIKEATDQVDVSGDYSEHSLMYKGRRSLERRKLENSIYYFTRFLSLYGPESQYFKEVSEKRAQAYDSYREEENIRKIRDLTAETLAYFDEEQFEMTQNYVLKILDVMRDHPDSSRIRGLKMDLLREMPDILEEAGVDLEEKITESKKFTQKASILIDNGQPEDALEFLSRAIEMDSKNDQAVRLKKVAQAKLELKKISDFFKEALAGLKNKRYSSARDIFKQILKIRPDNRLAKKYLERLEKKFEEEKTIKLEIDKKYQEAKHLYEKWEYAQAVEKFEDVLQIDSNHEAAKEYLRQIQNRLNEDNLMEDISFFFRQGVGFYEQKKWKESIACFNHVLQVMNDHKKALEYKSMAEQWMEQERIFKRVLEDGRYLFNQNHYAEALERFEYLFQLDKSHPEVLKYKRLCVEFMDGRSDRKQRHP